MGSWDFTALALLLWAAFTGQAESQETQTAPEMAVYPGDEPGVRPESAGVGAALCPAQRWLPFGSQFSDSCLGKIHVFK